jgi:hypothetical protein
MTFGAVATSDVDTSAALASSVDVLTRPMPIAEVLECVIEHFQVFGELEGDQTECSNNGYSWRTMVLILCVQELPNE